ncbi:MAG: NUDIX hydrolase [Oscillochloris sp.]|nr:NUDIX hydrolase [Oscillochloris sp.]
MARLVRAAGGVVYTHNPAGELLLLLIQDRYGTWTLPKGHLDPGEDDEAAARREIWEETGLHAELEQHLATIRYPINRRGRWRTKQVVYFLANAPYAAPTPALDEGITLACWTPHAEALARLHYDQIRAVVRKALAILDDR